MPFRADEVIGLGLSLCRCARDSERLGERQLALKFVSFVGAGERFFFSLLCKGFVPGFENRATPHLVKVGN